VRLRLHEGRRWLLYLLPLLALAVISNLRILDGQVGDDEANQLTVVVQILHRLRHGNLVGVVKVLSQVDQPPLRYLLSLPGLALFPQTGFGLRLGAVLVSFAMTWAIFQLGRELGGEVVAWVSAGLVAVSAAYDLTSNAFGWSVIVLALVQCIRLLRRSSLDLTERDERRRFLVINGWLALAFLTNTGTILFAATTLAMYGWRNRRVPAVAARAFAPVIGFYAIYHLYFFVVVQLVGERFFGKKGVFGQLQHLYERAGGSSPNIRDFLNGLQAVNGHFLPFVGWGLLAASLAYLVRNERRVLLWLAPFWLVWAFYMRLDTTQYFVLPVIATIPFGVQWIVTHLRRAGLVALAAAAVGFAAWNLALFVKSYSETSYPDGVLTATYSRVVFQENLYEPYARIARDLNGILVRDDRWIHDLSGGLSEFYSNPDRSGFVDPRFAGRVGSAAFPTRFDAAARCYRLRAPGIRVAVTRRPLCPAEVERTIRYPGSAIRLYVLRTSSTSS
jgi:hypothetical protein